MEESEQVVLLLDLENLQLLIVLPEEVPLEKNQAGFSPAALAERQAELWTKRSERLVSNDLDNPEVERVRAELALAVRMADLWTDRTERLMKGLRHEW